MYKKIKEKYYKIRYKEKVIKINSIKTGILFLVAAFCLLNIGHGMAAGYVIPGTDQSDKLTDINSFVATIIGFGKKIVAPALAFVCVGSGIVRCSKKKNEEGIPLIIGGSALVFVEKVMDSISKMM